jgi:APA family basic amino acid/polyamine antiporter
MRFTKPLSLLIKESEESGEHSLKRSLGSINLVALGIGAIIGAGLFSLTGIAAAENAGPAVTLSFIIAAVGCAFAGLCYAEFASMIPIAGSAYTYSYATMGETIAWIIGWDLVLEYALGAATVSVSWSSYLAKFLGNFGIHMPYELCHAPVESAVLADGTTVHGLINLPAIFIVFALSLLLIRGTKESAFMNGLLVALKVAVVLVFITVGWHYVNPENYTPYIPQNEGTWGHFGWSGVLRGAAVVFFAYIGFDAVSTAAQESKNPSKGMPIGILGSLVVSTILYILFSHVMTGMASYTEFKGSAAPVAVAIAKTPYAWLQQFIILAILAGYTSVILVMLLGQSRIFYSMSKDGLLPKVFSSIHPKYHTPYKNNLLFAVFTSLLAGFVNISDLGHMVSIGTLFAFVLVSIGIIVMRKKLPDAPRNFKTPLVPLVPILGIVVCVAMMLSLPLETWVRLVVWMGIGFVIYYGYSIKHSKIRRGDI